MSAIRLNGLNKLKSRRLGLLLLLGSLVLTLSLLTRIALLIKSAGTIDFTLPNLLGIFVIGFFYDLLNAAWVVLPVSLYLWLIPSKIFTKRWHRFILYGIFFLFTFGLLFNCISEWFFGMSSAQDLISSQLIIWSIPMR